MTGNVSKADYWQSRKSYGVLKGERASVTNFFFAK